MQILMIAHAFPPTFGGVESHLWDISTRLVKRGHAVCCLVGGERDSCENLSGLTVLRRPELTVQSLLARRQGWRLAAISEDLLDDISAVVSESIGELRPSLIHVHNGHHFSPELALSLFTQAHHVPLINGVHDRVGEHLFPRVMSYAWQHVLYASHYLRESIPTRRESSVLWLGIDLEQFSSEGELDPRFAAFERPVIFHPARLLRWKGSEVGLRAFIEVRSRLGRGTLVLCSSENIVDDGAEVRRFKEELMSLAHAGNVAKSVQFLAFDRSAMGAAYRASDLVWYPTIDDEPFGLVPLEAMACRIPLVVSRSGGMVETVEDGVTGLLVNKHDHRSLAEAAISLLTNEALRARLVNEGAVRVRKFDADCYVAELENLYAEVTAR